MSSGVNIPRVTYGLIAAAAAAVIVLALREANNIIAPMLMAVVLAIIISPVLDRLMKRGLPGWLALIVTLGLFVLILLLLVGIIALSLRGFTGALPGYQARLTELRDSLDATLSGFGVDLQAVVDEADLSPSRLLTAAGTFAQSLLSGIANWGVILLAGVFFLTYARTLPRMLSQLAGEGTDVVQRVTRFGQDVRRFMVITAYVGFLTAAVNVPLLLLIGVDFALLWGVLSFLLNFVPNIGFLLSVIPPALLALIELGIPQAVIVVVGFVLINGFFENVVKPRFIEQDLDIAPVVSFISLILWTWVFGALGAIIAIPMTMLVQLLLESSEETRWLGYLLGTGRTPFRPEPPAEPDPPAPLLPGDEPPASAG